MITCFSREPVVSIQIFIWFDLAESSFFFEHCNPRKKLRKRRFEFRNMHHFMMREFSFLTFYESIKYLGKQIL